jgi:phage/plasmid-associated DNA primase
MLIQRFNDVLSVNRNSYPEPDAVMQVTNRYQRDNNVLAEFFETRIVRAEEGHDVPPLEMDVVFEEFRYWMRNENPANKVPRKKDLMTYLHKRTMGGRACSGSLTRLPGYSLRPTTTAP